MSWYHLRDEDVKARKNHRCILCGEDILVGEVYRQRTGTDEGEIHTMRMHQECQKESAKWDSDDWECWEPYEMDRPLGI